MGRKEAMKELRTIKRILVRQRLMQELAETQPTRKQRIRNMLRLEPTRIAQSEHFVEIEQAAHIDEQIHMINDWLFEYGLKIKSEQDNSLYVHNYKIFSVGSEITAVNEIGKPIGFNFIMGVIGRDFELSFNYSFSPDYTYLFDILFKDPQKSNLSPYQSLNKPLDQMTLGDYSIIEYYLGRYIRQVVQKTS